MSSPNRSAIASATTAAPSTGSTLPGGPFTDERRTRQGAFETALAHDEILSEIRIPAAKANSGGAYLKLERKVGDYATAAVAVQISLGKNGKCESVGIGLTNVGLTPIKATQADLPLHPCPYAGIAEQIGQTAPAVMQRMRRMRAEGIIRRIADLRNQVAKPREEEA